MKKKQQNLWFIRRKKFKFFFYLNCIHLIVWTTIFIDFPAEKKMAEKNENDIYFAPNNFLSHLYSFLCLFRCRTNATVFLWVPIGMLRDLAKIELNNNFMHKYETLYIWMVPMDGCKSECYWKFRNWGK